MKSIQLLELNWLGSAPLVRLAPLSNFSLLRFLDYISFSAHSDYEQTSTFIRILKPPHIVLVHGEQNEMSRLKAALIREYEDTKVVS